MSNPFDELARRSKTPPKPKKSRAPRHVPDLPEIIRGTLPDITARPKDPTARRIIYDEEAMRPLTKVELREIKIRLQHCKTGPQRRMILDAYPPTRGKSVAAILRAIETFKEVHPETPNPTYRRIRV